MKKALIKFSRFLGVVTKSIQNFFTDIFGWIRSVLIFFKTSQKIRLFYGFSHFWFAKRYANLRKKKCKSNRKGDLNQCILPVDDYKLFVCSQRELKKLQTKGHLSNQFNYTKYFKKSYYNTLKNFNHE